MLAVSALNLVPVRAGQSPAQALQSMVSLAQAVEGMGYQRYWIAEHHNAASLLSAATQVLVGHTLAHTQSIRVGSGGVMLPNHSSLLVAEQYGTLATLYPGRVDVGLGRAPGTDQATALALRRQARDASGQFPADVQALQRYFGSEDVQGPVRALPGMGLDVPLYILGSSTDSALLAAQLGLPYAFAAHFAPRWLDTALDIYRHQFKPSKVLQKPYVIVALNVIAADTDEQADFLASTQQQFFLNILRGTRLPLQPPRADMAQVWQPGEKAAADAMLACSLIGAKARLAEQLHALQDRLHADELMAVSYIYDEAQQHHAYRLFHEVASGYGGLA
ncbi:MAG: LLM class flavin-dependent oxidoreductase [Pseudomonadota bacterium]|nr:LLM class flavin-dependent oxidoreductase [Pseudomonadota bacterium]